MRRGQAGDCMYFIIDGEVEIRLQAQELYLGPGQFFGEVALLTGAPRNATAPIRRKRIFGFTGCTPRSEICCAPACLTTAASSPRTRS